MLKQNDGRGIYIFSQPEKQSEKAHMFFVNHLGKFGLVIILFLILLLIIEIEAFSLKFILFSLIFVSLLTYLSAKFHRKFAYKVIIDFRSRKVKFHMYRSEDVIMANFDEIRTKRVPRHVVFVFNDRKVFYRGLEDNELLKCLNKMS